MELLTADNLKIFATIINIIASVILAYRVKNMLWALGFVAKCHENNIKQLLPRHTGDQKFAENADKHLEKSQGTKLLVSGFLLYALAALLNLIALIMIN